jgi:alkyldihydroxyacetonephosphate synthase
VTERSWWGWGRVDRALPDDECVALAALLPGLPDRPRPVPELADVALPASRIDAPGSLPVSLDPGQRASHTYGKAYRDVVRALSGDLRGAPDAVACPRSEADVVDLLDWAAGAGSSGRGLPSSRTAAAARWSVGSSTGGAVPGSRWT